MPDRLHFTGDDEADALLAHDPMALLVGFALDQQVPVPTAFSGPLKIKRRLGTLEPGRLAATQGLVPPHPTLGDVDSAEALQSYQEAKRAYKASLKASR
jgi:hypothetical protein